ncbi:unnamed protein product [Vitrella brassicaformis CCMP3155]|uniref:RanBD1 domain-containing protein n=2 Tax=Vitrella brassicaformis TaxID=1169539 RepID=A0A0G4FG72_VITBC|nr:unnamed protein product [Vitrella brassicaformis CCMP3155]|mmetsp:Transcript_19048/g.45936  ORF Transcript_19048/g.45936 Transcript_19048/m.45936 type:complete len:215 (+) Transcript_19048:75-719(+)|eukprot:CEM11828.1 unnamed protein product [Vitrella brassicaformis CCMP3155]
MSTAVDAQPAAPAPHAEHDDDDKLVEEEVVHGDWATPQVEVHEVEAATGEEEEDAIWKQRAKLFRWSPGTGDDGKGEWKERGLGEAKLLQHKTTKKVRFLLRQEKTLKVVANHYVTDHEGYCNLVPNSGSDKIFCWTVPDFAENELVTEQFGLKLGTTEKANEFKDMFLKAKEINREAIAAAKGEGADTDKTEAAEDTKDAAADKPDTNGDKKE